MSDQRQKLDSLLADGVLTSAEHAAAVQRLAVESDSNAATPATDPTVQGQATSTDDWTVVPLPEVHTSLPPPALPDFPDRPPREGLDTDSGPQAAVDDAAGDVLETDSGASPVAGGMSPGRADGPDDHLPESDAAQADNTADDTGAPNRPEGVQQVGDKVREWARTVFAGELKPYWIISLVAVGVTAVLATLGMLYVVVTEEGQNVPVIRLLLATFTGSGPLSLHAVGTGSVEGVGEFGETFAAEFRANLPFTTLSLLLLGTYAWQLRRLWRRRWSAVTEQLDLKTAIAEVCKATIAFVVVMTVAALLTRFRFSDAANDVTVRQTVSILSTTWWALLLGGGMAVAVMAVLMTSQQPTTELRPWLQEVAASARGALTSAGLLALLGIAIALVVFVTQRPTGLPATGIVSYVLLAVLYLPVVAFYGASLSTGIPITADLSEAMRSGAVAELSANPSIGLFGAQGLPDEAALPVYVWLGLVVAVLALMAGGLAASWVAQRRGIRTSLAGAGQGLILAVAWVPLTRLFDVTLSAKLTDSGGTLFSIAELFGFSDVMDSFGEGVSVRAGLSTWMAFVVMLLLGGLCGWIGSLLADPLSNKVPNWLFKFLGGGTAFGGGTALDGGTAMDGGTAATTPTQPVRPDLGEGRPAVPPVPAPPGPQDDGQTD